MTTNQTIDGVPGLRDLLERISAEPSDVDAQVRRQDAVDELRALLDEPAAPVVPCAIADALESAQWPNTSIGNKVLVAAAITELRKAAQPQGEPVAWLGSGVPFARQQDAIEYASYKDKQVTPLYAKQPAPVAVVPKSECPNCLGDSMFGCDTCIPEQAAPKLPEREPGDDGVCTESHYAKGWNDCLDEVTRLNGSKP